MQPPQMQSAIPPPMSQPQPPPSSAGSRGGSMGTYSDMVQSPQSAQHMGPPFTSPPGPAPTMPGAQRPSSGHQHERNFSHSSAYSQSNIPPQQQQPPQQQPQQQQPQQQQQQQQQYPIRNSAQAPIPSSRFNNSISSNSQGPPQLGALSFQAQQPQQPQLPLQQQPQPPQQQQQPQPQQQFPQQLPGAPNPLMQHPPGGRPGSSGIAGRNQSPPQMVPSRPVFGVSPARLYERDGMPVPMVVVQCIQAVDLFGLTVEGIYRLSGSLPHVNKLKTMFDTGERLGRPAIPHHANAGTQTRARPILTFGIPRTSFTTSIVSPAF